MPGTETSMPNSGLPVTMSALSTPDFQVPMILKSFGSLRVTVLRSGAVRVAALVESSAYVMLRPEGRWVTVPAVVSHSDAFTPHDAAAAATSICRPAAPIRRCSSQFIGVAVLPPANCEPYLAGSLSAC